MDRAEWTMIGSRRPGYTERYGDSRSACLWRARAPAGLQLGTSYTQILYYL